MPTLTAKENGKYKTDGFDRLVVNVAPGGSSIAVNVSYDNSGSGLSATNVQSAIDEVAGDIPNPSNTTPLMDGTAAVGTESLFARGDHRHPSDSTKVDKVSGMGLSSNDFTTAEKKKLTGIENGAEKNVQADWEQNDRDSGAYILHKPTIPSATSDLTNDSDFITSDDLSDRLGAVEFTGTRNTTNTTAGNLRGIYDKATGTVRINLQWANPNTNTTADSVLFTIPSDYIPTEIKYGSGIVRTSVNIPLPGNYRINSSGEVYQGASNEARGGFAVIEYALGRSVTPSGYQIYTGDYEVTPKTHAETVLETNNLAMIDDVTVNRVPKWETSNEQGTTVYIGTEE